MFRLAYSLRLWQCCFTIRDDWSIYQLSDGTLVRAKIIPREFYVARDPATDEILYNHEGRPIYGTEMGMEIHFDVPEKLVKQPTRKANVGQAV